MPFCIYEKCQTRVVILQIRIRITPRCLASIGIQVARKAVIVIWTLIWITSAIGLNVGAILLCVAFNTPRIDGSCEDEEDTGESN